MLKIEKVGGETAEILCRKIAEDLPEYFGIATANVHYAVGVRERQNFAAKIDEETEENIKNQENEEDEKYIGLISIEYPYLNNANIYWMGVLHQYQGRGIGHSLIEMACKTAKECGTTTMTVETLAPAEADENYQKTYDFYESVGFLPLVNLKPQGYEWNMVYMVKLL